MLAEDTRFSEVRTKTHGYLVHNERVKYTATFVNTIALGCIVVGVVTPLQRLLDQGLEGTIPVGSALATAGWLITGFALHWLVRWILGRLRE